VSAARMCAIACSTNPAAAAVPGRSGSPPNAIVAMAKRGSLNIVVPFVG